METQTQECLDKPVTLSKETIDKLDRLKEQILLRDILLKQSNTTETNKS